MRNRIESFMLTVKSEAFVSVSEYLYITSVQFFTHCHLYMMFCCSMCIHTSIYMKMMRRLLPASSTWKISLVSE